MPVTAVGGGAVGADATTGPDRPGTGGAGAGGAGTTITDPDTVKVSMTVQQVLDAFPTVTVAEIYHRFGVPRTHRPPPN